MNLSLIQTELVACALCEADGKNPDAEIAREGVVSIKAWQAYEEEARRFIVASRAMERWSEALTMFGGLGPHEEAAVPA